MKFLFVYEHECICVRFRPMYLALIAHGHTVEIGKIGQEPTFDTDVYLYGMYSRLDNIIDLSNIKCRLIILQIDDAEKFNLSRLSNQTINNTYKFLKNNWTVELPEIIKDNVGWLPTFINNIEPKPGNDLIYRNIKVMYYGKETNDSRVKLVELMYNSDIPFEGGSFIWENIYFEKAKDTAILLAPWGHHPMTYRLYEGLAYRSLVIGQRINMVSCINGDVKPDVHFISVRDDLGNLVEKVRYYLEHIDEAQKIADAGYKHYCKFLAPKDGGISEYVYQKCFDSWDL